MSIERAKSGHPGLPLGCADMASLLFQYFINTTPQSPDWLSRDRFVLSAGHGSMLVYALQYIYGFNFSIHDLVNFRQLGSKTPVIQTIFNPLTQAKNLAGKERLLVHMRRYPDALHQGLHAIKETTIRYIEALKEVNVSGVFYAVQHAQFGLLTEDEYREFGKEYDLMILEPAEDFWLNMLHIHGSDIMFNLLVDYPVQIINWHDRETYPPLKEAKEIFPRVLCGGLNRSTMVFGTQQDIIDEAQTAVESTGDKGFILGTGCVVPITAPYGNILAARKSVD